VSSGPSDIERRLGRAIWWLVGRPPDRSSFARRVVGLTAAISFLFAGLLLWADIVYRPPVLVLPLVIGLFAFGSVMTRRYLALRKE
jgi:hypothetical protein